MELGTIIEVNPVQCWNAKSSMECADSGRVTDANPTQFRKAEFPIEVTEFGITKSPGNWLQLQKAESLIAVSVLGRTKGLASPEQPEKALFPMDVTELGMIAEVRPVQLLKAKFPIEVTVFGMTVFLQPDTNSLVLVLMMALQLFRES